MGNSSRVRTDPVERKGEIADPVVNSACVGS